MTKEKRRKIGLTALEITRLNPQNKFLRVKTIKETKNLFGHLSNIIIKYCSSTDLLSAGVVIYYKKHSGIAISPTDKRLIDLELLYSFRKEDYFRSLNYKEPDKYLFKFANITETFRSTINILNNGNGESNN